MYWNNKKDEPGWEPKFLEEEWGKYEVAMQVLYPQSWEIKMHYVESLIRRKRVSVHDKIESVTKFLSIVRHSYKHELENLFSGMSPQKRFELASKRLSKISIGVFTNTSIKKESFIDIWSNPDVYKVLDWDITAPFDSDKNEYAVEKAKYSISYEQFRAPIKTINRKSTLELDRVIELMKPLGPDWNGASYLGRTGNQYYMENGRIKVQKYKPLK